MRHHSVILIGTLGEGLDTGSYNYIKGCTGVREFGYTVPNIVMKKYTAICSWACSWGCNHACSCLHTSTVMEQYTATCSRACSRSCSHLHKYKQLQAQLQAQLQITFI